MQTSAEKSIFLNALDKGSENERESYLRSACGADAALRASVDALLSAHHQTLNPLDQPIARVGALPVSPLDPTKDDAAVGASPDIGETIGPYRLMELIGEGGFGLVYASLQEKPVRRRVALKIIKPGTGTSEVLARFDAERQAIAMMDHPNIAQVFEAGATEDGRPYFVMELVRGVPITEFLERTNLSLPQKLGLFMDVCAAVHHAHQKGVIHRDLKPSNVLVTLHDTKPVAKVIDFGVAKAMGQNLTDQTIYTRLYSMIGTPLYMSPEQASMSGLDVDTRSDIYSLGVMLYELLTGTTPFDRQRLDTVGYDEMRRIIQEEEPPKPSVRLTTVAKRRAPTLNDDDQVSRSASDDRQTAKRDSVPSDLDWIVMKAMEKDRQRRYESTAAMAADLRRILAQEPIEARPQSQVYRLAKFARRNRVAIVTGSLVAVALMAGTAASLYQASRAIDERNQKELALQDAIQAKNEATDARLEVEQFTQRLKGANALLGSARSYEDAQQWGAAHDAYNRAVELVPNYYLVWVQRAQLMLKMKLWEEAANDFSAAIQLDAPADGHEWQGVPALFVLTERTDDYATVTSLQLRPSIENPNALSWDAIRANLAAPLESVDMEQLADRAEVLLAENNERRPRGPGFGPPNGFLDGTLPKPPAGDGREGDRPPRLYQPFGGPGGGRGGRGPNDRSRGQFLPLPVKMYIAGWAQLRAGRWQKAVEHLEQAAQVRHWPEADLVHNLIAMAHFQAGHRELALVSLQKADEAMEERMARLAPTPDSLAHWFDFVEMLLSHREATLLISGTRPRVDARMIAVQQDARALLSGEPHQ